MRIRIALSAALAALCFTTAAMTLLGSTPAVSASSKGHHRAPSNHAVLSNSKLAAFATPTTLAPAPAAPVVTPAPPVTTPLPPPPPAPVPVASDATTVDTNDWMCIRIHESGDRYNDPSEPSGAYGILLSTWQSFGYSGWPYEAAPAVQDALALRLYSMYGFHPWSSRYACGL